MPSVRLGVLPRARYPLVFAGGTLGSSAPFALGWEGFALLVLRVLWELGSQLMHKR